MISDRDALLAAGIDEASIPGAVVSKTAVPMPADPARPTLAELVAMHDAGCPNAAIAGLLGKEPEWVSGALAMAGIYPRRGAFEPRAARAERARRDALALRLRERGLTYPEIGARLGLTAQTARDSVLRAKRRRETP